MNIVGKLEVILINLKMLSLCYVLYYYKLFHNQSVKETHMT